MAEPTGLLVLLGGGVLAGGVSIGSKIIFDWLKNRTPDPIPAPAPKAPDPAPDIHILNPDCIKWKSGVDRTLVEHGGKIVEHEKRLDKGSGDFGTIKKDISGINKDIAGINTSLAVFAERLKKEKTREEGD